MKKILPFFLLLLSGAAMAQTAAKPTSTGWNINIDVNVLLISVAVFLLLPLWILGNIFITAAKRHYVESRKSGRLMVWLPLGLLFLSSTLTAQAPTAAPVSTGVNSSYMTIALLTLIAIELVVMVFFALKINEFLKPIDTRVVTEDQRGDIFSWISTKWAAANFVPIEEEHKIDLSHDYDGIRELDNVVPPWFTTAFLLTILFAGVYLYRYHIAKSAPMQLEELKIAMAKADLEHEAYLATQASAIDENSVVTLTGADLEAGQKTFQTLCAVCHKVDGGGLVGPNLTDDYWIHGGSIKDIFKTIKYGVPDKGMISWKEQLSPIQMAQVGSYIQTLHGTNPPDAKEKQGVLYVPEAAAADTTAVPAAPADTTGVKK